MSKKKFFILFSFFIVSLIGNKNLNAQFEKNKIPPEKRVLMNLAQEYKKLKEWQQSLESQEKRIKRLELEVITQQKIILEIQKKISKILEELRQIRDANVSQLAIVYSKMKPENSSQIIDNMPVDLAVKIFLKMQPNKIAKILNLVNRTKAIQITEKLAAYGIKINLRGR